jgi:hypothetical protein
MFHLREENNYTNYPTAEVEMLRTASVIPVILLATFFVLTLSLTSIALITDQYFVDETHIRLPVDDDYSRDIDLIDVDGDGDLDAFFTNSARGAADQSRLYINDGSGFFMDETTMRLPVENDDTRRSTCADFDGDRDLDIFIAAASYDPCRIWMNDGEGLFSDESATRLPSLDGVFPFEPKAGDLDKDGDFDLLIPAFGQNILLINDGTGNFSDETGLRLPGGSGVTSGYILFDFDFDNDLDVFESNNSNGRNRLLMNDGHGFFSDESEGRIPTDYFKSWVGREADYNGDNWIDVLVSNASSVFDQVWMNYGGFFTDESSIRLPSNAISSYDSDTGDINNDGWPDLVFANSYTTAEMQNMLYLNEAGAFFIDVTGERMPQVLDETQQIRFGDLDGDDDIDIVSANMDEQNRIYINNGTPDIHAPQIFPPLVLKAMEVGPGPFPLYTHVLDYVSVNIGETEVSLFYQINGQGDFTEIPMDWCGGELYKGEVPDQTGGRIISYYFQAVDRAGNVSTDPENAPPDTYYFYVGGRDNQNPLTF